MANPPANPFASLDHLRVMKPLHLAAAQGSASGVMEGLAKNWDPNTPDEYGITALGWGIYGNSMECVQMMLASGGDPELEHGKRYSEFYCANSFILAAHAGREQFFPLLREWGVPMDTGFPLPLSQHALITSASQGHLGAVTALLQPEWRPAQFVRMEGMRQAAKKGHLECVQLLMGPRLLPRAGGRALVNAIIGEQMAVMNFLLEQGADPDAHDGRNGQIGVMALTAALTFCREPARRYATEQLLSHGADARLLREVPLVLHGVRDKEPDLYQRLTAAMDQFDLDARVRKAPPKPSPRGRM